MNTIEIVTIALYMALIAFCVIIGLYRKAISEYTFFILTLLLGVTLIVESVGYYNLWTKNKIAGWIFLLFLPVQYLLYSLYFKNIIKNNKIKRVIIISVPILLLWNVCNTVYFQNFLMLNTYAILLACLLYCIWSSIYLIQLLQDIGDENLAHNPHFWISTGTLFFYSVSFFIIAFIQIINKEDQTLASQLWFLIRAFNIILYGLFAYGFICQIKRQNSII